MGTCDTRGVGVLRLASASLARECYVESGNIRMIVSCGVGGGRGVTLSWFGMSRIVNEVHHV